ncbi:hypothetical protein EV177_010473, partial [Coemansia sp. RSA 1804]
MTVADPATATATAATAAAIASNGDYTANVYSGKQEHRDQVCAILEKEGQIPMNLIDSEVEWFYDVLGLDD